MYTSRDDAEEARASARRDRDPTAPVRW
jgi:hypothetical protein